MSSRSLNRLESSQFRLTRRKAAVETETVAAVVCTDAGDVSPLRQTDCQLATFNAYSHDAEDDNDDLTNPATPITSVSATAGIVLC